MADYELEEDMDKIVLAITNLAEYLNGKYIKDEDFDKEVVRVTKTLYDPLVEGKGIEKGIEKGREEEKRAIAKALLDILDDEMIAMKTGLSKEEVVQLR